MKTTRKAFLALGMALGLGWLATQDAHAGVSSSTIAEMDLLVTFNGGLSVWIDNLNYSTYTLLGYSGAGTTAGNPGPNAYASPTSSATVVNSGNITERWELDVSTINGGGNWQLNNATGTTHTNTTSNGQLSCAGNCPAAEQYGFQALFVSSKTATGNYGAASACPSPNAVDWDQVVSTVPAHAGFSAVQPNGFGVYLAAQYADTAVIGGADGRPDFSQTFAGHPTSNDGDMLPLNNTVPGAGQKGLCVRMTMPSTTVTTTQQTVQLEITAIGG